MAKSEKISDTSWKQPFSDRKKEMKLFPANPEVASFCEFKDKTKRKLNVKFEKRFNIDETRYFQITSGKEIYFPKVFQNKIGEIIFNNPESFFIVTVLDSFEAPYISNDEKEQNELEQFFKKNKSKADILNDLKNIKDTGPVEIIINHKTFKRDNKTIAQLKIIRDFKCQVCGVSIPKKDGSKYVEAAHIISKHIKGKETPDNIILLCPNHHKEFDLGEPEIIIQDVNQIEFLLNGKLHKLKLSLE